MTGRPYSEAVHYIISILHYKPAAEGLTTVDKPQKIRNFRGLECTLPDGRNMLRPYEDMPCVGAQTAASADLELASNQFCLPRCSRSSSSSVSG